MSLEEIERSVMIAERLLDVYLIPLRRKRSAPRQLESCLAYIRDARTKIRKLQGSIQTTLPVMFRLVECLQGKRPFDPTWYGYEKRLYKKLKRKNDGEFRF